jgi:hypothetical protein
MALSDMGHSARGVARAEALDTELAACRADLYLAKPTSTGELGAGALITGNSPSSLGQ